MVLDSQGPSDKVDARFGRRPAQFCKYTFYIYLIGFQGISLNTIYDFFFFLALKMSTKQNLIVHIWDTLCLHDKKN